MILALAAGFKSPFPHGRGSVSEPANSADPKGDPRVPAPLGSANDVYLSGVDTHFDQFDCWANRNPSRRLAILNRYELANAAHIGG